MYNYSRNIIHGRYWGLRDDTRKLWVIHDRYWGLRDDTRKLWVIHDRYWGRRDDSRKLWVQNRVIMQESKRRYPVSKKEEVAKENT